MLVPNQMIEIKWGRTNSTHYKKLGYVFAKIGDVFKVHAEELLPSSKAIVQVQCDECGKITTTTYQSYLISLQKHPNKYYCKTCVQLQSEVKSKIANTIYQTYGADSFFNTDYFKTKSRQTNLKNLGVEFPMQSAVVKDKARKAFANHGNLIGFQNPQSRAKARKTLADSGMVPTSSQQRELFNLLCAAQYNCELNKPLGELNLDIALFYNNICIDIEVDGAYWHKDTNKDRRRDEFVKSQGYKVLRITINHNLPNFKNICNSIDKLSTSEHSFYQIAAEDVDNN